MWILYLIAGFVALAALTTMVLYHHKALKMTSVTVGRVVRATEREVRDEQERRDETVVVCQYTVRSQDYEVERTFRGRQAARFPAGHELPIRYNPAIPEMARIAIGSKT